MSRNTAEYRALRKATGKLTRVGKNNITSLCVELFAKDLISADQQRRFRNTNVDALERAADLVQVLTDKVEENSANYYTIVGILGEDRTTFNDVLECLSLDTESEPGECTPTSMMAASTPG